VRAGGGSIDSRPFEGEGFSYIPANILRGWGLFPLALEGGGGVCPPGPEASSGFSFFFIHISA